MSNHRAVFLVVVQKAARGAPGVGQRAVGLAALLRRSARHSKSGMARCPRRSNAVAEGRGVSHMHRQDSRLSVSSVWQK